jgi:peptide/nickel transport system ATP-binding protein
MPRCPLAESVCAEEEPTLVQTDHSGHLAACHFHSRLIRAEAATVFVPTSADTTDLPAATGV